MEDLIYDDFEYLAVTSKVGVAKTCVESTEKYPIVYVDYSIVTTTVPFNIIRETGRDIDDYLYEITQHVNSHNKLRKICHLLEFLKEIRDFKEKIFEEAFAQRVGMIGECVFKIYRDDFELFTLEEFNELLDRQFKNSLIALELRYDAIVDRSTKYDAFRKTFKPQDFMNNYDEDKKQYEKFYKNRVIL